MPAHRRVPLAAVVFTISAGLAGCVATTPASTPGASVHAIATPGTSAAPSSMAPTPALSIAPTQVVTAAPSLVASAEASQMPITTPVPGSSLDPTLSDTGIAGRLTIADDTRDDRIGTDDRSGTHEILGRAADGSDCSYSFEGDEFTAVAWYDDAPDGMLHQMAVTVPTDEMPANDGEQRTGIADGRVYADFASESGFGSAYSGDSTEAENGGSSTIDAVLDGGTLTLSFSGTTWDAIAFSGQLMCTGMASSD